MNLRDILLLGLTGSTQQELQDQAALGRAPINVGPEGENLDKAIHALASQAIAERFGPTTASAIGGGKELLQGVYSATRGRGFFGPHAYDPEDIEANYVGIRRGSLADLAR
jgi:hypothetical protein